MIRWTARQKKLVIELVRAGTIPLPNDISPEEFAGWVLAYSTHGSDALKTTRLQEYRADRARPKPARKRRNRGDQ